MRPEESDAKVCQSDATCLGESAETRAAVVLARAPQAFEPGTSHYYVPFLAHLVATKTGIRKRANAAAPSQMWRWPPIGLPRRSTHFSSRVRSRLCAAP